MPPPGVRGENKNGAEIPRRLVFTKKTGNYMLATKAAPKYVIFPSLTSD